MIHILIYYHLLKNINIHSFIILILYEHYLHFLLFNYNTYFSHITFFKNNLYTESSLSLYWCVHDIDIIHL